MYELLPFNLAVPMFDSSLGTSKWRDVNAEPDNAIKRHNDDWLSEAKQ